MRTTVKQVLKETAMGITLAVLYAIGALAVSSIFADYACTLTICN